MHYANTYLERPVVGDLENVAQEGTTKVLKCMLNTGSDIYQGACKKRGSTLKEEYKNASGTCYMDPRDMVKLGVKNWDTVLVKTDYGEVVRPYLQRYPRHCRKNRQKSSTHGRLNEMGIQKIC